MFSGTLSAESCVVGMRREATNADQIEYLITGKKRFNIFLAEKISFFYFTSVVKSMYLFGNIPYLTHLSEAYRLDASV